jgi:hypothetical protein
MVGRRKAFAFRTEPIVAGNFTVTDVLIDAEHALPLTIAFTSASGALKGKGKITLGPVGRYWAVREVTVVATAGSKIERERIAWSKYRFPETLPEWTFSAPRPLPSENP